MIGDYDSASFSTPGEGRFRPLAGRATPPSARSGRSRSSTRCGSSACWPGGPAAGRRGDAGGAPLRGAGVRRRGARRPRDRADRQRPDRHGRGDHARAASRGRWPARCRRRRTACGWPATPTGRSAGWRCAGERATSCSTRCARTDADVYVTSDLRHHPASEFLEHGGPALVDVAHWAAEWTWLPVVAAKVAEALGQRWGIRWRPGSARSAPTHGRSSSTIRPHRRRALKADPAAQLALLDLQELDSRADLLRHQRETLPELAEIAALTAARAELDGKRRDAQISVDDLTAEQAKVDADVEQVKTRRTRDQDRMDQGLISNPKDLERMQGELESLQRRITSLEDDELEVMARLEDAAEGARLADPGGRRRRPAAGRARQRARRQDPGARPRPAGGRGRPRPHRGRHPRRPAGALRQAAGRQERRRRRARCGPASAAAAGSRSTRPSWPRSAPHLPTR